MAIMKITMGRSFSGLINYLFEERERERSEHEMEVALREALDGCHVHGSDPAEIGKEREAESERKSVNEGERVESAEGELRRDSEAGTRGEVIAGNLAGRDARELTRELEAFAAQRPQVEVCVIHISVSTPPQDRVTREVQRLIAARVAPVMLPDTAWMAVRHKDHEHDEFHFAASKIGYGGKPLDLAHSYLRGELVMREVEREFGLTPVASSREAMHRCPSQGEVKLFERTSEPSVRMRVQATIDEVLERERTTTEFVEQLRERGVGVRFRRDEAKRVVGVSYGFEGRFFAGGRLGRGYTFPGLQKDWQQEHRKGVMDYEHSRDHEADSLGGKCAKAKQHGRAKAEERARHETPDQSRTLAALASTGRGGRKRRAIREYPTKKSHDLTGTRDGATSPRGSKASEAGGSPGRAPRGERSPETDRPSFTPLDSHAAGGVADNSGRSSSAARTDREGRQGGERGTEPRTRDDERRLVAFQRDLEKHGAYSKALPVDSRAVRAAPDRVSKDHYRVSAPQNQAGSLRQHNDGGAYERLLHLLPVVAEPPDASGRGAVEGGAASAESTTHAQTRTSGRGEDGGARAGHDVDGRNDERTLGTTMPPPRADEPHREDDTTTPTRSHEEAIESLYAPKSARDAESERVPTPERDRGVILER